MFGFGRSKPAQRKAPPPFVPASGSSRRPDRLTIDDFDSGQAYISGREYQLAYYEVPRNEVMQAQHLPLRLYLRARVSAAGTNDGATTETVNVSSVHGLNAIRSTRGAPTLPSTAHPDVAAQISTDSGATWSDATVTAYDAAANTVTFTKPASTAFDYRLYVLSGNGQLRITADAPAGSGALQTQIANTTLAAMHEVNQSQASASLSIPGMFGRELRLSQKFRLSIYVTTDVEMVWANAGHEVVVPVYRRAVNVLDPQATVRKTLQALGV